MQLLPVALMAAQCHRPLARPGTPHDSPARSVDAASTSWCYLIALPTFGTGTVKGHGTTSRTTTENRLALLRTTLGRL